FDRDTLFGSEVLSFPVSAPIEFDVSFDGDVYKKVVEDVNQRVLDGARKNADGSLSGGRKIGTDTDKGNGTMAYVQRSFIDQRLSEDLVKARIVDKELAQAILMVDFTRPASSEIRCGLLDKLAPAIEAAPSRTAADIKAAVVKAIGDNPADGDLQ